MRQLLRFSFQLKKKITIFLWSPAIFLFLLRFGRREIYAHTRSGTTQTQKRKTTANGCERRKKKKKPKIEINFSFVF